MLIVINGETSFSYAAELLVRVATHSEFLFLPKGKKLSLYIVAPFKFSNS